ncbi:MAG: SulP family inorganic anion transporter [Legionellaceae bacterium]|nr:SulP family inorganic anion transporter [Legionellaceae bacterium]
MASFYHQLRYDLPASIIVFFVALPLCLGIALASGAPLFSGIISGIIGGIVVGMASGSALGVSGPAAGLTSVVLSSVLQLGSWETFLLAVVIAGVLQLIAGYLGGGVIAYYFPSSVIKGMLAGIGLIIILKQIPLALGINANTEDNMIESVNHIFSSLMHPSHAINLVVTMITTISILILIGWETFLTKKYKIFQFIQGPMVVVLIGIVFVWLGQKGISTFQLGNGYLVNIPIASNPLAFVSQFHFPDFSQLTNITVYKVAGIVALIASIETLLCLEATDKLDPEKHITPTDRELKAQGLGNIICGLIGGLPVTQVIVRSSANITFGAKTKLSTILHGILLLICVTTIPAWLNMIPLSTLAAILFVVGYKLASPALFTKMYRLGWEQFVPFITTVLGVIFEDLLVGISIGMTVSIFIILKHNYSNSHTTFKFRQDKKKTIYLILSEEVSFLNTGSILHELRDIPRGSDVIIDASKTTVIDYDVQEAIRNFMISSTSRNITVHYLESKKLH